MTKDTVNMNVSSSHPGTVWVSKKLLRDMPGMRSKHVQPQLGTGSIGLILDHVIPLYRRENSKTISTTESLTSEAYGSGRED